ncbi:unnamed protein product [Rotaria sp. Silwood2]|nr:unnamed protein product [Rotaria sp. Silwood2]CAF3011618.1 unnamed protein product [Rotaria sp. Silwood2]CAF3036270.1 unnamed protein product [Rotaria sp. Silwood2]CAF4327008.1 unnamed protein product [Rotaria sp. Silwood2]
MNQHKTISTLIELGRQKKKRRLNLQRDNYEYHTDLDINIIESFTSAAYRFSTTEENDEFKWNDSISTSHNNTNGEGTSIIANCDQYLHDEYLQDVNHNTYFTLERFVKEQELPLVNFFLNLSMYL